MSRQNPRIEAVMTKSPHSIGVEQTLERARTVMTEHGVRHLPVLHGGKLVGVVTERDVHLVESLQGVNPKLVTVSDAMSEAVYCVPPDALLVDVAREMAEHKYGSTVVVNGGKVVGIFTTVDACRALAESLHS
jgi:acetoin utilization protein AcuB